MNSSNKFQPGDLIFVQSNPYTDHWKIVGLAEFVEQTFSSIFGTVQCLNGGPFHGQLIGVDLNYCVPLTTTC